MFRFIPFLSAVILVGLFTLPASSQVPSPEAYLGLDALALLGTKEMPVGERVRLTPQELDFLNIQVRRRLSPQGTIVDTVALIEKEAYQLGNLLFFNNRFSEASAFFEYVVKSFPNGLYTAQALYFAGEANLAQGEFNRALEFYNRQLALYPSSRLTDQALYSSAWAYLARKDFGHAHEAAQRLLILFPPSPLAGKAWYLAGLAKAGLGQYLAAVNNLKRLLDYPEQEYDWGKVYYLLCYSYLFLGDYGRASGYLEALERKRPLSPMLTKLIFQGALLSYTSKEYQLADRLFAKLLARPPGPELEPPSLFWAMKVNLDQGRRLEAGEYYGRLSQSYFGTPWEKEAFKALISFYRDSGPLEERQFAYLRFLEPGVTVEEREENYLRLAEDLYLLKAYDLATISLEDFLKTAKTPPRIESALFTLGQSLFHTEKYARAREVWSKLLSSFPEIKEKDQVLLRMGEAARKQNDISAALGYWQQIPRDRPLRFLALRNMGEIYFSQRDWTKTLETFNELFTDYPQVKREADTYLRLGQTYFHLGEYSKSAHYLFLVYAKFPNSDKLDEGLYYIADGYYRQSSFQLAAILYRLVSNRFPDSPYRERALLNMGNSLFNQGELRKAAAALVELYRSFPNSEILPQVLLKIANVYFSLGNYLGATFYYLRVGNERPHSKEVPQARYGIVVSYLRREKYDQFVEKATSFLKDYPNDPLSSGLLLMLGRYHQDRGEGDQALGYYQETVNRQPRAGRTDIALLRLGQIYQRKGELEKATSYFQRLLSDFPESSITADGLFGLGVAYQDRARYDQAREAFEAILTKYPQSEFMRDALFLSGESCRKMTSYSCAKVRLMEFSRKFPGHHLRFKADLSLGLIYQEEGDYDQAARQFSLAVGSPDTALAVRAHSLAAKAYLALDRQEEAEAALNKIINDFVSYEEEVEQALLMKAGLYLAQARLDESAEIYRRVLGESKVEKNRLLSQEKLKEIELLKAKGE